MGQTPLTVRLSLPKEVMLKLEGYEPMRRTLRTAGEMEIQLKSRAAPATADTTPAPRRVHDRPANPKPKPKAQTTDHPEGLD
jgi:hypothetical protein